MTISRADIENGVRAVLLAHAPYKDRPLEHTSRLVADLGFDSVQVIEIVGELEERFDISIPLDDPTAIQTVGHVIDGIERLIRERQ